MRIRLAASAAIAALTGVLLIAPSASQASAVDFDCTDFSDQATAQEYLHPGDPHALDLDGNGIACEGLPCPCVREGADSRQTSGNALHLTNADARRAAGKIAREFARSEDGVTTAGVEECHRRAPHRIDCLAVSRGKTTTTKTLCRLRIAVRATARNPHAGLLSSKCQTWSSLKLTAADALAELSEQMREIIGQPVQIVTTERESRLGFRALAEWTRPEATGGARRCTAFLTATLIAPPDLVEVSVLFLDCKPA